MSFQCFPRGPPHCGNKQSHIHINKATAHVKESPILFLLSDCSLDVSVHPEDPATGHLDFSILLVFLSSSKCWDDSHVPKLLLRASNATPKLKLIKIKLHCCQSHWNYFFLSNYMSTLTWRTNGRSLGNLLSNWWVSFPAHSKVCLTFPMTFHFHLFFYYTVYLSVSISRMPLSAVQHPEVGR
jgi:hypothetical protein